MSSTTRRRFDPPEDHTNEIRRIYDNSDMLKFMATRYNQKRKGWSVTVRKRSQALPEISTNTSTREGYTRYRENNNNSVCMQRYPKEPLLYTSINMRRTFTLSKPTSRPSYSFIFKSSDFYVERLLRYEGWQEVRSRNNTNFSLKWVNDPSGMDFMYLRPNQKFNHIKNLEETINLQYLTKRLGRCDFWCKTFDCSRDYEAFGKEFESCALLNLLKKHINYFRLKEVAVAQRPVSIVDMLKHAKFTQTKNASLLVNVPVLVQACLYYEQLLDGMGMSNCNSELDIHLDAKSMINIVAYSRLNPPYDQYEDFKHSYIQNYGYYRSSTRDSKAKLNFSRGYHRYNSYESMATPSEELILLLMHYDRLFRYHTKDYLANGTENQWVVLEKYQAHRTWKEQLTTNRKLSTTDVLLVKAVERPLTLHPNKLLIFKSYVLLSCDEPGYQLYMMSKHYCEEVTSRCESPMLRPVDQKELPSELIELEDVAARLQLGQFKNILDSQLSRIVNSTLNVKLLERRRGCFAMLTYHTIVDEWLKVWLQDITEGCNIFHQNSPNPVKAMEITEYLIRVLFTGSEYISERYWKRITGNKVLTPSLDNAPLVENSLVRLVQNRIRYENIVRRFATILHKRTVLACLKSCSRWKENRLKSKLVDLRLGLSMLSRILRKRVKLLFTMLYR